MLLQLSTVFPLGSPLFDFAIFVDEDSLSQFFHYIKISPGTELSYFLYAL